VQKFSNAGYLKQRIRFWVFPQERDPFRDDPEAEFPIGSVKIWLKSLGYMLDTKEQLDVTDLKGREVGLLNFELVPCDRKGRTFTDADDVWVENPHDLIGHELHFTVKINSARGLPAKYTVSYNCGLV
jgi:kinesin family protein 1